MTMKRVKHKSMLVRVQTLLFWHIHRHNWLSLGHNRLCSSKHKHYDDFYPA